MILINLKIFSKNLQKNKKNMKIAKFFLDSEPEFRKCEIFAKPAKSWISFSNASR